MQKATTAYELIGDAALRCKRININQAFKH